MAKIKVETRTIQEPTGRSKKMDRMSPERQDKAPKMGETMMIFLISCKN